MNAIEQARREALAEALRALDVRIRIRHPTAERPDPDGEPPWARIYGQAEDGESATGEIACPAPGCDGTVSYHISGYNGHLRLACNRPTCCIRMCQ